MGRSSRMCRDGEGCALVAYSLGLLSATIRNGSTMIIGILELSMRGKTGMGPIKRYSTDWCWAHKVPHDKPGPQSEV
jgi:hypothetical protein